MRSDRDLRCTMKPTEPAETKDGSHEVDELIASKQDWRGAMLAQLRQAILAADPAIVESIKWRKPTNPAGVAAWECSGLICTGETYKDYVKLTFASGAALADPQKLFNASLTGGTRRAIDVREKDTVDAGALTRLVAEAVAYNRAKKRR